MQCKVKNGSSQVVHERDFTAKDVCGLLGVSASWLANHRELFEYYRIPGRGRTGLAIRFTRKSVEDYRRSRIKAARDSENPYAGKTLDEIRMIAIDRVRRGLVSTSS